MKIKILVTGNKNGLGRYLFEELGTVGFDRDTVEFEKKAIIKKGAEVIIHCAFNSIPEVTSKELPDYLKDNLFLTRDIVQIPHNKFLFISSVDVYPKDRKIHKENEIINLNQVEGIYGISKLFAEAIIREYGRNFLILRSAAFLGPYTRKGSLKKIAEEEKPVLTLKSDSEMNYVLYEDVLEFIKVALKKDLRGIYNIASSENIRISEIVAIFHKKAVFGKYRYKVGKIDNSKAVSILPSFNKTSEEIIRQYYGK